jgi:hypothetical protein
MSLVGIGTLPTPLSPVCSPPPGSGGRAHSPAGEGLEVSPNFDDWRKSLALCLLCACTALQLAN